MGRDATTAVVLVAHGTVTDLADLPAFLLAVRRGRPAGEPLVRELRRRYEAIGGSPLLEVTRAQAHALQERLALPVLMGMRFSEPGIGEAFRSVGASVRRVCILPLAPFNVEAYAEAAERAAASVDWTGRNRPTLVHVAAWGSERGLAEAHAERIGASWNRRPGDALLFTAHSIPSAADRAGDPYAERVRAAARGVGDLLGAPFTLGFQSQGADGGEWIGPDLRSAIAKIRSEGASRIVVAPIGFVADHVETLYDLDIEARAFARDLGLDMLRVPALNTDPGLIGTLASVAEGALGLQGAG